MITFTDNNYMLCIVILFILFMIYYLYLNCHNQITEGFQTDQTTDNTQSSNQQISMYLPTIIDNLDSIVNKIENINLQLKLNIYPYSTSLEDSDKPNIKKNQDLIFPVHKILVTVAENQKSKYKKDFYLIIANNGLLYTQTVGNSLYEGPLNNSVVTIDSDNLIPMKMIIMDNNSNLYGVGFDGILYKKNYGINNPNFETQIMDLESEWVLYEKNYNNLYYVLFVNDNQIQKTLLIKNDGSIYIDEIDINNKEEKQERLCELSNINNNPESIKIFKLMHHRSGYLLGIGDDLKLYRSEKIYNDDNNINKLHFNFRNEDLTHSSDYNFWDLDYDNYGRLRCQVVDNSLAILKSVIQTGSYFTADFKDINSEDINLLPNKDIELSNKDIINYKCGTTIIRDIPIEYGENNLDQAIIRENIRENKKLREFCKAQNYHYDSIDNYHDFDLKLKINSHNQLIKELENKIKLYSQESQKLQE